MLNFDRYHVLTFDCYGTLIDWESGILKAVRPVLETHGAGVDDQAILEMYAQMEAALEADEYMRYQLLVEEAMAGMGGSFGIDLADDERRAVVSSIKDWRPFPDTVAALKRLKKKYKLAIISNIDDHLFAASAVHLDVAFDWVVTAEQSGAYKPSPRMFEFALERIGQPKEAILHVAQSRYHDIAPARKLGLQTVWVNRRTGEKGPGATPPSDATPDLEVASLAELADAAGL
ncbi:MAG: haloacid dehalogenase type II [Candidatus Krumholzibacteria bacterium]